MSKQPSIPATKYFVACGDGLDIINRGGSIALSLGYTDHQAVLQSDPGKYIPYVDSKDHNNRDKPKRFLFNESFRRLMTRASDKDNYGISQYDWLKNYPTCEGSPYGDYVEENGVRIQIGVQFRELDSAKDAEVALQADVKRIEAQADVLALDEQTLTEIAAILGQYGEPDQLMRLKVLEFAGKQPSNYFKYKNAGDRAVRAIVRKALKEKVFTTKGEIIMWDSTVIGANEDAAVSKILTDQSILDALQEKLGLKSEIKSEKKRPGNPNLQKKSEPA